MVTFQGVVFYKGSDNRISVQAFSTGEEARRYGMMRANVARIVRNIGGEIVQIYPLPPVKKEN